MGSVKRASEIAIWLHRLYQTDEHEKRYFRVGGSINETIDTTSGRGLLLSRHALENRRMALLRHAILNNGRKTVAGRSALSEYNYLRDY